MKLNETAVAEALYSNPDVRNRIARDYGIENAADTPTAFLDQIVHELAQPPNSDPLRHISNAEVYEAAVLAIGSNSRTWAKFLANRDRIYDLLGGPDVSVAGRADPGALAGLLTGTTRTRDARAIIGWAQQLAKLDENYYGKVRQLATRMTDRAADAGIVDLPNKHLMLCLVGHLIDEPVKSFGDPYVGKLLGMRFALGSEFFRNLGWDGFKPDRHIIRLLDNWVPDVVEQQRDTADRLAPLTGRRSKEIHDMMRYSLAGIAISHSVNYSRTDNLIWLLGAYVEKKRRSRTDRDHRYLTP